MKPAIYIFLLCSMGFPSQKIPELHDTTIAVFPNTNPGDSLRFRKISYDGVVEKLMCYSIGKTIFPFKITNIKSKDTFPEFDSASILVSEDLKNLLDTNKYNSLVRNFPSFLRTDTETVIKSSGAGVYTTYCQCHSLAIVFSFVPNKKEGISSGAIDALRPPLVIREIFETLKRSIPTTTKIVSKSGPIVSKSIKIASKSRFLVNGRAVSPMKQNIRLIPNRLISKGF
jgi:hypothetical protein